MCLCEGKGEFAAACLACILLFASVLSCWRVEEGHLVGWCGVYGPELDWTTVQEVHVLLGCVGSAGSWPMGRTGTDRIGPRCGCSWYFSYYSRLLHLLARTCLPGQDVPGLYNIAWTCLPGHACVGLIMPGHAWTCLPGRTWRCLPYTCLDMFAWTCVDLPGLHKFAWPCLLGHACTCLPGRVCLCTLG